MPVYRKEVTATSGVTVYTRLWSLTKIFEWFVRNSDGAERGVSYTTCRAVASPSCADSPLFCCSGLIRRLRLARYCTRRGRRAGARSRGRLVLNVNNRQSADQPSAILTIANVRHQRQTRLQLFCGHRDNLLFNVLFCHHFCLDVCIRHFA